MQLVLVLPDLFAERDAAAPPVRATALARLLALASEPERDADGPDAALASLYGIERQTDWPTAALEVASLGIDPAGAYWLAADPVTLDVGRDDALFAGMADGLARADADALTATLNAHFRDDGLTFIAPRPDAMFARVAMPPRLRTHPLAISSDSALRSRLPEGLDANIWRRWQSEIQMLLHDHPVNVKRVRAGRPPANTVWFSGGGTLPPRPTGKRSIRTYAHTGLAVALASHAGSPAQPVPASLTDAIDGAVDAALVVVALSPGLAPDAIEASWAAPSWRALASGRIGRVTLIADNAGDAVTWRVDRPPLWKRLASQIRGHDLDAWVAAARRRE
ncbi:MAG: hypothetical protein ABI724_14310 [Betaproteobacteria bacterium]